MFFKCWQATLHKLFLPPNFKRFQNLEFFHEKLFGGSNSSDEEEYSEEVIPPSFKEAMESNEKLELHWWTFQKFVKWTFFVCHLWKDIQWTKFYT